MAQNRNLTGSTDHPQTPQLVRRTFEGKNDVDKNQDPITSKYMESMKYAVVYFEDGQRKVEMCHNRNEGYAIISKIRANSTEKRQPTI